jgi:hypothetical protein
MCLCVCMGPVVGQGFYAIFMNYLHYLCEIFIIFAQQNRTAIYDVRQTRG